MLVKTEQLLEGCILTKDVRVLTNRPIIRKKTILSKEHLEVLQAYLIEMVEVEPVLATGEPFTPQTIKDNEPKMVEATDLYSIYHKSVLSYKTQYNKWQAGSIIDYSAVRSVTIQLMEQALNNRNEVRDIHKYSNEYEYIYHHAIGSTMIATVLASHLGFEKKDIVQIAIAAFLMDCGMSRIDQRILQSDTILRKEEFDLIKEHPVFSYQMVSKVPIIQDEIKIAILQHHERLDKSGYPFGLIGGKLHKFSKIIAVADVYHAMVCKRRYKKEQSPFRVIELLQKSTFGQFDLEVVNALVNTIGYLPVGTKVNLSNGKVAEVTFVERDYPTRPLIKMETTGEFINLKQKLDLYIERVL